MDKDGQQGLVLTPTNQSDARVAVGYGKASVELPMGAKTVAQYAKDGSVQLVAPHYKDGGKPTGQPAPPLKIELYQLRDKLGHAVKDAAGNPVFAPPADAQGHKATLQGHGKTVTVDWAVSGSAVHTSDSGHSSTTSFAPSHLSKDLHVGGADYGKPDSKTDGHHVSSTGFGKLDKPAKDTDLHYSDAQAQGLLHKLKQVDKDTHYLNGSGSGHSLSPHVPDSANLTDGQH